ncbi:uncharacterized protein DDB_G0284459-like [Myzus persicae]|uniref:uncharacterized protein DDB_G0284459-like n=1 Tax=Myzus persicae TaxID=13164 RepID=UPI000B938287|nr:uncharacterized protein DDB_G0284459-like [Myzus persicae]XP_022164625.1 uncharacterized protein DDB_G0284459-like [Myzus persicae]XP_022164626.1 uncharacterized protein DDB_G0284459-like [Myzus persicae]XP_022164627.1 uncharacterized protein DDB_G0284459-like [Myzus persicae]XP_022164628.1 uncharacterized protein DDB_G0284459-like [Myzus persicae]XP_022164629.1 uncharacterized protein DDB_G0284459-like [Myzus persicae]
MTTKLINNMNLNCAVKLLRYDDLPTSNNEDVLVADNQANAEVKRSGRISRKRTKPNIENVKKKNCMIKKPKLSKLEPGKTDTLQQETKNTNIQDSSIKSTESYLINDDLSETSGSTVCTVNSIDNKAKTSTRWSTKPKPVKFKISKSIIAVRKKPLIPDVNKDKPFNDIVKADTFVAPLKSSKTKTPKDNTSNRKKPVLSNVSKNNTSSELEESNSIMSIKTPKNKSPKSTTPKKKSMNNVIINAETQHELEMNDNFAVPEAPKSKTPKSIVSNKKKPLLNSTKRIGITFDHETSNKIEIPRKRSRASLKKEKCQKPDYDSMFNNEDSLNQTQDLGLISRALCSNEGLKLSQNSVDSTMMLRSNNKPPKIKKKWSEEWSGDKLSTNILKANNEEFSSELTLDVNSKKKISKTQKSKTPNCKKVKTKLLEEFDPKSTFYYYTPIPAYDDMNKSSINVPVVHTNDNITFSYHIPLQESIPAVCNDAVPESVGAVGVSNTQFSESSSNVSITLTTGTENTFSNNSNQQSHLSTLESISDPDYLSVPMISTENPEMSYGMAILSEAISRQCRELDNEKIKKKSPEPPDIIEKQPSPMKEISTSQSQMPSGEALPQRVIKDFKNKIAKRTSKKFASKSVKNELESRIEHEINILSKRFDIPTNYLMKTVVEEPLSVFHTTYSKSVTPSMVEISPIDVKAHSGLNVNYVSGNIDVKYKLEPIREGAAYEKKNLKDLMLELSKTMPSWSLSIVTNPPRYVISHMSIDKYGVPTANKCIVLDRTFRASVYINQSLEHTLCKRYTTATEIVNLIKELNSI